MVSAGYSRLKYCGPFHGFQWFQTFHLRLNAFKTFNRSAEPALVEGFNSFKTHFDRPVGWNGARY
jgi:hypothetical protein